MQGLFLGSGFSCGLDWSLPDNHFENVNSQGKFSYWQKLGEIKVGDDFAFPIHLNFRVSGHFKMHHQWSLQSAPLLAMVF